MRFSETTVVEIHGKTPKTRVRCYTPTTPTCHTSLPVHGSTTLFLACSTLPTYLVGRGVTHLHCAGIIRTPSPHLHPSLPALHPPSLPPSSPPHLICPPPLTHHHHSPPHAHVTVHLTHLPPLHSPSSDSAHHERCPKSQPQEQRRRRRRWWRRVRACGLAGPLNTQPPLSAAASVAPHSASPWAVCCLPRDFLKF